MAFLQSVADNQKKQEESKKNYKVKKDFIWKNFYNTSRWRKLRLQKLTKQPLCEMCKERGIIRLANTVHHIKEISTGNTPYEMEQLAFDYNNLQALCKDCHKEHHKPEINYFLFDEDKDKL